MQGKPTAPVLYTAHEVAAILKVHPDTIYEMVNDGRLDGVKLGKARNAPVRIYARSLDRLLGGNNG